MDKGVIIDVETTGINPETDRIIEVGVLQFMLNEGEEPIITTMYSGLEDPGFPLTQEIKTITGITDAALKGQVINWPYVAELIRDSEIAIAHNASFDRGFLMKRAELAPLDIHWACSLRHIAWDKKRIQTRALNYLAAEHGFVNPFAHRALFDCATTFRIISPYLEELIFRSYKREIEILALHAPFEQKDKLKQRQYRWNDKARVWCKVVLESELDEERTFLATEVYAGQPMHREVAVET
jgi:DNA polymerase III subunit epsilon